MSQAIASPSATQIRSAYDPQSNSSTLPARRLPCMRLWTERYRQRRALFNLADADTHLLDDIGLLRDDAMREAAKRFWLR